MEMMRGAILSGEEDSEKKEKKDRPVFKMAAEVLESGAKKILEKKISLNEILGDNWKERCMGDIKNVLSKEEINLFTSAKIINLENAKTDAERQAVKINDFFEKGGKLSNTRVITGEDGQQRLLILSNIGDDIFYQMIDPDLAFFEGNDVLAMSPKHFGLVNKDGKFFSIDKLLLEGGLQEDDRTFVFLDKLNGDYRGNFCSTTSDANKDSDIVNQAPHSVENIGSFFHELGHLIRKREFKKDRESFDAAWEVMNNYSNTKQGESFLSFAQLRQLKVLEERGAWAIAMQILKEANRSAGLSSGNSESLKRVDERAHASLATYDEGDFNKKGLAENDLIPSFSKEKRMAARRLRYRILNSYKKYSDVPNFDQTTGETIHDPEKINDMLFGDKSKTEEE